MIDINNGLERKEVLEKAKIIRDIVAEHGAYFEATQLFTRVFAKTFLEVLPAISLVHLLRDPMEVARSYVNRKSYPSRADRPWRLPLNLKHALFKFPGPLTPFQENLCDWLENELRYLELKPQLANTVDFSFANYRSPDSIIEMFDALNVSFREANIICHTSKQDLDRNANRRRTRISRRNISQSKELLVLLKDHGFPGSLFQRDCYQEFEFTRQIAEI